MGEHFKLEPLKSLYHPIKIYLIWANLFVLGYLICDNPTVLLSCANHLGQN